LKGGQRRVPGRSEGGSAECPDKAPRKARSPCIRTRRVGQDKSCYKPNSSLYKIIRMSSNLITTLKFAIEAPVDNLSDGDRCELLKVAQSLVNKLESPIDLFVHLALSAIAILVIGQNFHC
jgi:hypothetical protein